MKIKTPQEKIEIPKPTIKTAELLIFWIKDKNLTSFKTKEALEYIQSQGITKTNFFSGIQHLINTGVLSSSIKGVYVVENAI